MVEGEEQIPLTTALSRSLSTIASSACLFPALSVRVLLVFVCSLQSSSGVGGAGARRAKTGRCDFAEGCDAAAMYVRFGLLGREQRFCHQHRQAPHRNLNNLKARLLCQHAGGCSKLGTFGPKTSAAEGSNADRRPAPMLFCKMHKLPGDPPVLIKI